MNIEQIFETLSNDSFSKIKNNHYYNRYRKLIEIYSYIPCIRGEMGSFENHHILPKTMFPELKKEKWNIIRLPARVHYIAHYLLFKSISDDGLVFAFNQMRRITNSNRPNCKLYEAVRKEFAILISKNNSGKRRTAEFKNKCAERTKNTNLYRSPTGELRRFIIGSEPFDWVSFQTGRKRTKKSKKLMSDRMSGRMWQYNQHTKEVKFERGILPGFTKGFPPWFDKSGKYAKDSIWIHHIVNKNNKRIKVNEPMPEGYQFGRYFEYNPGFERLNHGSETLVLDLLKKEYTLIDKSLLPNPRFKKHGMPLEKIYLFKYNGTVYASMADMSYDLKISRFSSDSSFLDKIIPKKHHNQKENMKKLSEKFEGKTYRQAGFEAILLSEYQFNEEEIYVRY